MLLISEFMMKQSILSLGRFANAKLFRLSYAVHRYDKLFRKPVPCRYKDTHLLYEGLTGERYTGTDYKSSVL